MDKSWIPKNNRKTSMVRQIQNNLYVYTIGSSRKDYIYEKFKSLKCDENGILKHNALADAKLYKFLEK